MSVGDVVKRFGEVTALDHVSLGIGAGESVGVLGPNGAGKSTLLGLALGLRAPTSGRVRLLGGDPRDPERRQQVGSTPQRSSLPEPLRVGEVLHYVAAHYRNPVPAAQLAEEFGLGDLLRRQCGSLSGGQQRRVGIALAFIGAPRIVVLDEPTVGLDLEGRAALWEVLRRKHREGCTIIVTSHHLDEIEALAKRVVVIDRGRVLADDPLADVLRRVDVQHVSVRDADPAALRAIDPSADVAVDPETRTVNVVTRDADRFVRGLVGTGTPFRDLTVRGATLEEAFVAITRGP
ncbi:ABC transporter ATP-binding protein [Pseudoclavibacter chungangensis]|uniref:ABC transporter ATP-binding protein n=1 Tax=Pseudoclavibacter chungangensis TaxID=587635 RepID=A0A7J5C1V7_9MICO|nr:ABC transporter ATP-binding protein [Pseudoclavibacter chungangensis]KAB1662626.1 ABC transporter ATP-binding protein [Pseudoclavibacter chungangensis]